MDNELEIGWNNEGVVIVIGDDEILLDAETAQHVGAALIAAGVDFEKHMRSAMS